MASLPESWTIPTVQNLPLWAVSWLAQSLSTWAASMSVRWSPGWIFLALGMMSRSILLCLRVVIACLEFLYEFSH